MRKISVARLILIYSVLCVFSNFIHPVTPTLLQRIGCPDFMFGIAFATMATTNFLTSPFWGKLGDNYGYVKVISIGCLGYAFGQFLFSTAVNSIMVIVGRAVSGLFASAYSVGALAYVSQSAEDGQARARYLAVFAAMQAIGTAVGFLIGGLIGDHSIEMVFFLQVAGVVATSVLFYFFLGEVRTSLVKTKIKFSEVNPISSAAASIHMISVPMGTFLLAAFLTNFATNANDTSFNYFLKAQLSFPPSGNGIFKAIVGVIGLLANFTINMWIIRKTDIRKSIILVLTLCGASLVLMVTLSGVTAFLISAIIFYTFNAIYLPIQQALIVKNDDGTATGMVAGIFNAARSLGMILGPTFSGFAYGIWPKLPFIAAGIAFFAAAVISYINDRQYSKIESMTGV